MFDLFLSSVAATLVGIKVICFCVAIWSLVHLQFADAIAFVLIGEFLGWVGKTTAEIPEKQDKHD